MLGAILFTLASHGEEIPWRRDLDAAQAEARASGQPIFAVFRCER